MAISAEMTLCECGCGQRVTKIGNRFINGHWIRLHNPMENSISVMKISGDNSPAKRSEVRHKMSERRSAFWLNYPELNPMKNPITAKKMGRTLSRQWREHPELNPMSNADSRAKLAGDKNPNWQGGYSKLPYPFGFDNDLKETIRARDNYTCQLCGITEEEHLEKYLRRLQIHHIDYDKGNLADKNLICLCLRCNVRVNFSRTYWCGFFRDKIKAIEVGI